MVNLNNCYCGREGSHVIDFPFTPLTATMCERHIGFYVGTLMNEAKGRLAYAVVERVKDNSNGK